MLVPSIPSYQNSCRKSPVDADCSLRLIFVGYCSVLIIHQPSLTKHSWTHPHVATTPKVLSNSQWALCSLSHASQLLLRPFRRLATRQVQKIAALFFPQTMTTNSNDLFTNYEDNAHTNQQSDTNGNNMGHTNNNDSEEVWSSTDCVPIGITKHGTDGQCI